MSRVVPLLFVALLLTPAAAQPPQAAPAPRPATKPVAPPPRLAGEPLERDLLNEDPGLQRDLEAALPEVIGQPAKGLPEQPKPGELPAAFAGRTGKLREQLVKEFGGNEASEKAVAAGLAWLARQQKADGSWVYDGTAKEEVTAATGMAVLAFLGSGETHTGKGKYAKSVKAGVNWLVNNLPVNGPNAGKFGKAGTMYAQGIGTLALVEAYALSKDKTLLAPAQAAINYIQRAQAANGSWGYAAGNNGDTSIVGWQVQALQAASLSKDIKVDPKVVKKTNDFLNLVAAGARQEKYGYSTNAGAAPGTSLTAIGLWCRCSIDKWDAENKGMIDGVTGLMARAPAGTTAKPRGAKPAFDMYFYYYATQVVLRFGGDEWQDWNEGPKVDGKRKGGMRDWLVELQVTKAGANLGSWDPETGFIGNQCGRVGTTALCVLTLEAYYRYPPTLKKKELDPEIRTLIEEAKGGVGLPEVPGIAPPGGLEEPPLVTASFPGRQGATRSKLLKEGGGNAESERAVALGLAWLARQQKADGSWTFDGTDKDEVAAATGLALLPFLAAGETHKPGPGAKYQKAVAAGLNFLLKDLTLSGADAGKFKSATSADAQAIATLALCEAYGMTKDRAMLHAGAQAAVNRLQKLQAQNGNWPAAEGAPADTSLVAWPLQALQLARLSQDIVVDPKVIKKAVEFLDATGAGARKSAYGRTDNKNAEPGTSLTAAGLLCRYYTGWEPTNAGYAEGVMGLMTKAPGGTTKKPRAAKPAFDAQFTYYATQVVRFFEGDEWRDWNEGPKAADGTRGGGTRDWLISLQVRKDGKELGSFDPDAGTAGKTGGRHATTCLAVLTLEVYYRHLPLYKRGGSGGALKVIEDRK
jgi:hypothetical protein